MRDVSGTTVAAHRVLAVAVAAVMVAATVGTAGAAPAVSAAPGFLAFPAVPVSAPDTAPTSASADPFPPGVNRLVSRRADGSESRSGSGQAALSADGRYVAFTSVDPRMIPGQRSRGAQVYLRDLQTGATELVSRSSDGSPAEGGAAEPDISADGTRIVFESSAINLAPGTDGMSQVYAYDATTKVLRLLSTTPGGQPASVHSIAPSISADGMHVAYASYAAELDPTGPVLPGILNIYRFDASTGRSALITRAYQGGFAIGDSTAPDISGDGRRIAFSSEAENLVPEDDSVRSDVYLFDAGTGDIELVSRATGGGSYAGEKLNAAISTDGDHVAYDSTASSNPADPVLDGVRNIYRYDVEAGTTTLVTRGMDGAAADGDSVDPTVSADGSRIACTSAAENLVAGSGNGVRDVFWQDLTTGVTALVSHPRSGTADGNSTEPAFAPDGAFLSYTSGATNLVRRDSNGARDVFVQRLP